MRDSVKPRIVKRLKEVRSWLGLSEECLGEWTKLGIDFNAWVCDSLKSGAISNEEVGDRFPVVWTKFLEATGATDDIEFTQEPPTGK